MLGMATGNLAEPGRLAPQLGEMRSKAQRRPPPPGTPSEGLVTQALCDVAYALPRERLPRVSWLGDEPPALPDRLASPCPAEVGDTDPATLQGSPRLVWQGRPQQSCHSATWVCRLRVFPLGNFTSHPWMSSHPLQPLRSLHFLQKRFPPLTIEMVCHLSVFAVWLHGEAQPALQAWSTLVCLEWVASQANATPGVTGEEHPGAPDHHSIPGGYCWPSCLWCTRRSL